MLRAGVQNHYSHRVRIGNWNEDQELKELQMKEYLYRKSQGRLLVSQVQGHLNKSLQQVGLSFSRDNQLHIGDHIMAFSAKTQGVLSVDVSETISLQDISHPVTTSTLTQGNVARNTFVIEGYGRETAGSVLKYGQKFRIRINPKLCPRPYYLSSQPVSHLASSQITRSQLVSFSPTKNFDTVWTCQYLDIGRRFEMEGSPVSANTELVIVHCATRQPLQSDMNNFMNDFGQEYEVCCRPMHQSKKKQELKQEFYGRTTTDTAVRQEEVPNHWAMLTASDESMEALLKDGAPIQDSKADPDKLLTAVRDALLGRRNDPVGINLLGRSFRVADADRSGALSYQEFRDALHTHGFQFTQEEAAVLCAAFDVNGDGNISYTEFLKALRGSLSPLRAALVDMAFRKLDRNASGTVTVSDIAAVYDVSQQPEVREGKKAPEVIYREFLSNFEGVRPDGLVTRQEFHDYYANVSAYITSDDYFEFVVRSVWRLQ